MAQVEFKNVRKAYNDHVIVEGLDLELPAGSMTVLVGPSGCGKSTTLRMLAGLETVTSGTISISGRDVTDLEPKDRDIAMVFQNYALYPHLTVRENIAFPLRAGTFNREEAYRRVDEVAAALGLAHLLERKPKDLSGGQQQRVAIGRAIIRKPAVFLFDEPLSNLDAKLRVETRSELVKLQRSLGATSLYVTHDQEEAMTLSDRMAVMNEGRIVQLGSPLEVYGKPNSVFVATFVGSPKMNIIPGAVELGVFRTEDGVLELTVGGTVTGPVQLGVRADELALTPTADGVARVEVVELLGPRAIVTLTVAGVEIKSVVEADRMAGIVEGAQVALSLRPESAHFFDSETGQRLAD